MGPKNDLYTLEELKVAFEHGCIARLFDSEDNEEDFQHALKTIKENRGK